MTKSLVSRLDDIIDGYYYDSEDYRVLHSLLKKIDEARLTEADKKLIERIHEDDGA